MTPKVRYSKDDAPREWQRHLEMEFKKRTVTLSFDELTKAFQRPVTFYTLATEWGVSRERVRQIYQVYFSKWAPRSKKTGRGRLAKVRKRQEIAQLAEARALNYLLQLLRRKTRGRGIRIDAIPKAVGILGKRFRLNGYLASVREAFAQRKTGGGPAKYYGFQITRRSLEETDLHIFLTYQTELSEPSVYIIPNDVLLDRFGDEDRHTFYIPANGYSSYNNIKSKTNFDYFLNNWGIVSSLRGMED